MPFEDIAHPPWNERAAMERAISDIVELEDRPGNPKGRGRWCSI